jgi:signal transduction histidine kinase
MLPTKSDRKIKITIQKQAYNLKILYSNNGPSIPESQQKKIFELFVSRYEEGTGLGLSIVREILDEYEGQIEIKANPEFDPGATFDIKIPLENLKK